MKKSYLLLIVLCLFFTLGLNSFAQSQNPYKIRRQKILQNMSADGLCFLQTTDEGYRFGFNFQQNSDLYYLTGLNDRDIILILSKHGIICPDKDLKVHSILLINPPQEHRANKDQYFDSLATNLQFDLVGRPIELRKILESISAVDELYTNVIRYDQKESSSIIEKKLIKFCEKFPDIKFKSPSILTASLRQIKSADEIAAMQKAINITMAAQQEAFKSMRPGLFEYQIEAVIEFMFRFSGSQQLAFETIVGAGPNSLVLHYDEGLRKIESGDIVVMDIGCEHEHYCADITRTIPASGKFTKEQTEVYNVVLEANQEIIKALQPGFTMAKMDSIANAVIEKAGFKKHILHSCTHYLGLDVHDVGDRQEKFKPGCVVTVEPGIYIPPNSELPAAYWNIGVRIEDDVLITEGGCLNLSAALPKTISEIEVIMKLKGMSEFLPQ